MYLIYLVGPLPGWVQGHSSVFCSIYKKQPLKCLMQKYLSFYHSAIHLDSLTHSTPSYLKYGRTEQVVHVWKITGHFLKMISNLHSCRCKQMPWTDQITDFILHVQPFYSLFYSFLTPPYFLPVSEWCDDQPASVSNIFKPVLQICVHHSHSHRLILKIIPKNKSSRF